MKFSIAKHDITPDGPVFQCGYGSRNRRSEGVLMPVYMTVVLLHANKNLLIVTIDSVGSDRSFIVGTKDALRERFGFGHDEVLINFSHTHHSVGLTGLDTSLRLSGYLYSLSQTRWEKDESALDYSEDENYFRFLRDTLLDMVANCFDNLAEGELLIGRGQSELAISRRLVLADGSIAWAPNEEAEIDKELFVLKLQDAAGELKSLIYAYGCHTTAMGDVYDISNDFAGFTATALLESYPGIVPVFLQSCAGELKPRAATEDGYFIPCTPAQAEAIGRSFAADIVHVLSTAEFRAIDPHFETALHNVQLPVGHYEPGFLDSVIAESDGDSFEGIAALRMKNALANGTAKEYRPLYIALWKLDRETGIVSIEGEVSTEYSLEIKKLFGNGKLIVLGYTNGVMSYIPTAKMISQGGYEAECNYFFDLRGPFLPEIEDVIVGRVARMLGDRTNTTKGRFADEGDANGHPRNGRELVGQN